jgi:ParB/RepB/Spo0J family partition protein
MSIVATLTEAENRQTPTSHAFASIPLNKLVPWDGNVRKTNSTEGLAELTANIEAHGVLQSLVVTKTNRGRYKIIAGRRRFLALSSLAEAGNIAPDAPVPCRIIAGSADATEIGLAENIVRAPMHPADQFDAFRTLIDDGASIADVAARFGVSETAVKQRLKLARVSPVVFEAYRKGDLDLEQVQAFAVSDDHAAQDRIFGELPDWDNDPGAMRSALTQDEIAATDKRVRFVTVEGYETAGGMARRDLFAEGDEGVFILDAALLDRLVRAKLEAAADFVRAEDWKWVEIQPEADYAALARFQRRHPEPLPLSEEAAAEHKRLAAGLQGEVQYAEKREEARRSNQRRNAFTAPGVGRACSRPFPGRIRFAFGDAHHSADPRQSLAAKHATEVEGSWDGMGNVSGFAKDQCESFKEGWGRSESGVRSAGPRTRRQSGGLHQLRPGTKERGREKARSRGASKLQQTTAEKPLTA